MGFDVFGLRKALSCLPVFISSIFNYSCSSLAYPELWENLTEEDIVISANMSLLADFSEIRNRIPLPLAAFHRDIYEMLLQLQQKKTVKKTPKDG